MIERLLVFFLKFIRYLVIKIGYHYFLISMDNVRMKKLLIFLLLFILVIPVSSTITVFERTDTYISYNITFSGNFTYAMYNGNILSDFDNQTVFYKADNLIPNSYNIFRIYYNDTVNDENITQTLPSTATNKEQVYGFIFHYIIIFFVIIILGIALLTEPIIAYVGIIFAFYGLSTTINYSFEFGAMFIILIVAGFFIVAVKKR